MNENKDNLVYIHHILDAINQVEIYLEHVDFEIFSSNRMIFDAVTRELEIIGEASNNIEADFQKQFPDIPWRKVVGTRNLLIHEYFGINKKVIWDACQDDIPELKKIILKIISDPK
ncbi:MAG: DUF86 domain-containing protein [Candidatus Moraniibacteriota bacterium]